MKIIIPNSVAGETINATPVVKNALEKVRGKRGAELVFEKGEYHFYREGASVKFLSAGYNTAEDKTIAFLIEEADGLTIDGSGSLFVFHDMVFPFVLLHSKNVVFKNFTTDCQPFNAAVLTFQEIDEKGFTLSMDEKYPYRVEEGALIFDTPSGESSGLEQMFALHAADRFKVQYFWGSNCKNPPFNPAAACIIADGEEVDGGVRFTYCENTPYKCFFQEKEKAVVLLTGMSRNICLMLLDNSEEVLIQNVTVRRNIGMCVVAVRCKDLTIDGLNTDEKFADAYVTSAADVMHCIHCYGKLEVKNCNISYPLDDPINVHGVYTSFQSFEENKVHARVGHQGYKFSDLYKKGDELSLIDNETLEYVGSFTVESVEYTDQEGWEFTLEYANGVGLERAKKGFYIENPKLMPDVWLHHNHFWHYPNNRFSGGGNILIEDNVFENGESAFLVFDLMHYWYESGRVKNLVCRNNTFINCNGMGGESFFTICVFGVDEKNAPKVHERIEFSNNVFEGIKDKVIVASALKELVLKDNVYKTDKKDLLRIDGKVKEV